MSINVMMPALSPTMEEGTLAKWLKKEGDMVEAGDVIAEIETDKATMEVEAVDEGILGKIIVAEGTRNVPVNDIIAVLLEEGEKFDEKMITAPSSPKETKQEKVKEKPQEPVKTPAIPKAQPSGGRIFASPLAKRLAKEKGLDLSQVKGSGPHGRIVKADVESAKLLGAATVAAPTVTPAGGHTEIPNNNIKKITAARLLEAKQTIPHFYLTIDCMIDSLLAARKDINEQAGGDYKLSVNDFIIKAAAMALQAYPAANVSWSDEALIQYASSDMSVAVATPNGLITPIVKAAEHKGLRQISEEVKELAGRAREGKLKPEEFQGGSFTISNLGMYGIKEFSAIINPPQSCILAVGAGNQQPVVENGEIVIRTVMTCTLSVDHRSVDGTTGAEFLQIFKQYIENPVSMLV